LLSLDGIVEGDDEQEDDVHEINDVHEVHKRHYRFHGQTNQDNTRISEGRWDGGNKKERDIQIRDVQDRVKDLNGVEQAGTIT